MTETPPSERSSPEAQPPRASARTILLTTLGSAAVAAALLFCAVLPAETGYDPTGLGKAMGLTALSRPPQTQLRTSSLPLGREEITFTLEPFGSIEYKFRMQEGDTLVYAWTCACDLEFEMHAEPDNGPNGFAESYLVGKAGKDSGAYTASFTGIHGWYWENRGPNTVELRLAAFGHFTSAIEFYDGKEFNRETGEVF